MEQRFLSPQTASAARHVDLVDLVSELLDAHTDTVQLFTGGERTELEWLAHSDYLRALHRLGRETLAGHDQHTPTPPPFRPAIMSRLGTTLTRSWTAAAHLVVTRVNGGA